ncbi:MAG TPA: LamG-like jellyroll fold domain-containing protein [Streptosporangiaceae bacterium]|nr:LamG-like jellyroll fold domain-containing protein [Streptosporangiaceae bacterium]
MRLKGLARNDSVRDCGTRPGIGWSSGLPNGRLSRQLPAVIAGLGLALGGVAALPAGQAAAAVKPITGHRFAGQKPRSSFARNPGQLRGSRHAVAGKARPAKARPVKFTPLQRAESAAMTRARQTGKPVVVSAATTPTVVVKAHPDGLLSMTSNVFPVRVKVHGTWKAINANLSRTADGSWAPQVASVPVTFSGGGTGPLVTVPVKAGQRVALYWPAPLPRPRVKGAVALYKNVLPGVDLRLEATGNGYQEALVVHDRVAAANPKLRRLAFQIKTQGGLTLRRGAGNSLGIADSKTGKLLYVAGEPQMWDSSRTQHFSLRATADAAGSGRVTVVPAGYRIATQKTTQATITMTPPASALTGKYVRYPLFIDPEISPNTSFYAQVMHVSNGYNHEWDTTSGTTSQPSGVTEVGYCGYSDCIWDTPSGAAQFYTDRDYFRFNTTNLEKQGGATATVYFVSFDVDETGNSNGCTSRVSDLYSTTGGISASTAWGGPQGSQIAQEGSNKGGGSNCPAGNVDFPNTDAGNGGLKTTLQSTASNGNSTVTLELRADSETNELQYKTYKDNPSLSVYYNFAPLTPTGLSVQDQVTCDSNTTYTSLTKPRLFATGTDNNPNPLQITLNYTLETSGGTAAGGNLASPTGASGSQQSSTPSTALANGTAYKFRVSATNNPTDSKSSNRTSPNSAFYPFTVLTGPTAAPTISSFDYPQGQWGQPAGAPGDFTVGTNGQSHIAGFAYSFDGGAGSEPVPTTTDCRYNNDAGLGTSVDSNGDGLGKGSGELALVHGSAAQIEIPGTITPGPHTLFVVSFDFAHNVSAESAYIFYVPQNYQGPSQPVTYINGGSLAAGATGANASLVTTQANCCGLGWRGGSQLIFNGAALAQTFTVSINVPDSGLWQLGADLTLGKDYGQQKVVLDQASSNITLGGTGTVPWDGYSSQVTIAYLDLGTQNLSAGAHTLTFTMTGQNASSTGFKTGINYLTLSPTGRYEAESLSTGTPSAGALAPQYQFGSPWSDNGQLLLTNTTVGAKFTVNISAPVESDYALGVNLTTGASYGSLRFDLDPATSDINLDNTATSPLDAYSASLGSTYVFLGGVHLTAGAHVLQVTVTGNDPSSTGDNAGIDFVEAAPVTGATDASFTAAMNNLGIATDGAGSFGGNFDLTGFTNGKNLSVQAMQSAGITPGTASAAGASFTLNGANFTMPELSASGATVIDDNVIPDGQTIPLPAIQATDVALLAATTCGNTVGSPTGHATLNYSGGSSSQPLVTSVPDWTKTFAASQIVLSHWDIGTTADTTELPHLYEVMLPANPNATLSSITLPVLPVNFLGGHGCATAGDLLHILAIGTRPVSNAQGPAGTAWTGGYAGPMDAAISPAGGSLNNTTLREKISVTSPATAGQQVRIQLSNSHARTPVTFDAVTLAAQSASEATVATPVALTFGGSTSVTIPVGGDVYSDPVARPAGGTGLMFVSMHIPSTSPQTLVPIHETVNASSYYTAGNQAANSDGTPFVDTSSTQGLYYLSRVDVSDPTATDGTIAVLGDQTAAQAPNFTYGNWASHLSAALQTAGVALPGSVANISTAGEPPAHWWRMNGTGLDTATTAYDSGSSPTASLTLGGGATWTTDDPATGVTAGALSLNGTSGFASSSGQVVNTAGSYAVSAWVSLSSVPSHNATVVAQDGTSNSGFYLGVRNGDWAFYFANSDTTGAAVMSVTGPAVTAGTWTQVAGVYNSSAGTAQLYVNGTLAGSTAFTGWASTGSLTVGRDKTGGTAGDFLPGEISDVQVFSALLFGTGIQQVYTDNAGNAVTAANAGSWLRLYVSAEPNLRDVIVSVGATDVLEGASAAAVESNLRSLVSAIQAYFVDNDPAAPSVQVILTTIVPLGMSSTDPREAVRQAVNSWITGDNTTAQVTSDVAAAVAQPGSPNLVNSSLLSDGVPTTAYYTGIASQIATDVSNAIPIFINGL